MSSLFRRGYDALKEEEKRREEYNKNKAGIYRLFVKEGDAPIVFLTEEPVNFYEHTVKNTRNGKEYFDNFMCTGKDCPLCEEGDRPSFKSAWLVIDLRPYEYEKNGKTETIDRQLKLYVAGTKTAGLIQKKSQRYGLLHKEFILDRIGKGQSTTYSLDKEGRYDIDEDEINDLLPEVYQDMYDGSVDSLMDIIEAELSKSIKDKEDDDEDDNDAIIGVDDDEPKGKSKSKFSSKKGSSSKSKPKTKFKFKR